MTPTLLRPVGVAITVAASLPVAAVAADEAIVALYESGRDGWGREARIQALLKDRFGFDMVNVVTDATPAEMAGRVAAFVTADGKRGDRRLVWVSGLAPGLAETPCPAPGTSPVRTAVPTTVLAPACFEDLFHWPRGARRFAVTTPESGAPEGEAGTPALSLIALPSDDPRFATAGDAILLDLLARGGEEDLAPGRLLAALRHDFKAEGSRYTPALVQAVAPADGASADRRQTANGRRRAPIRLRPGPTSLHGEPDGAGTPVLRLHGGTVRVLRLGPDRRMAYVSAPRGLFGWVRTDDLQRP